MNLNLCCQKLGGDRWLSSDDSSVPLASLVKFPLEFSARMVNSQPATFRCLTDDLLWCQPAKAPFSGLRREKKGAGSCTDPALVSDSDQLLGRYHGRGRIGRSRLRRRLGGLTLAGQAALPGVFRHVTHRGVEGTVFPFFNVAFDGVHHQLRQSDTGIIRQLALRAVIRGLTLQSSQATPRIERRLHLGLELFQRHAGKRLRRAKRFPGVQHGLQLFGHAFRIWFGHLFSPPFCLYPSATMADGKLLHSNPTESAAQKTPAHHFLLKRPATISGSLHIYFSTIHCGVQVKYAKKLRE